MFIVFSVGELTAHCMGPHKVAFCELYDHRDGTFTLNIKPQEPGRHVLQVKYGGEHVPGKHSFTSIYRIPLVGKQQKGDEFQKYILEAWKGLECYVLDNTFSKTCAT